MSADVHSRDWYGRRELEELNLDAEPPQILDELCQLVADGVALTDLAGSVAYAAARRLIHFGVSNEFSDWKRCRTRLPTRNAVDQALRRAPSNLLARAVFDGAMSVHLDRFLNVPKQSIPTGRPDAATSTDVLAVFGSQGHVDEAGQLVADMLEAGRANEVIATLGYALLREDAGFHSFQMFETAV